MYARGLVEGLVHGMLLGKRCTGRGTGGTSVFAPPPSFLARSFPPHSHAYLIHPARCCLNRARMPNIPPYHFTLKHVLIHARSRCIYEPAHKYEHHPRTPAHTYRERAVIGGAPVRARERACTALAGAGGLSRSSSSTKGQRPPTQTGIYPLRPRPLALRRRLRPPARATELLPARPSYSFTLSRVPLPAPASGSPYAASTPAASVECGEEGRVGAGLDGRAGLCRGLDRFSHRIPANTTFTTLRCGNTEFHLENSLRWLPSSHSPTAPPPSPPPSLASSSATSRKWRGWA
ncbi:hypothetical protein K438DRAFT_1778423 [Mycena galopus ATCC 62051]|nr:hypothetical protein K438DRAFT_1778423 [Mycena galopus ATCC 62051]